HAADGLQLPAIDPVGIGLGDQEATVVIVADHADGGDREGRVEPPDVDGEVAARAAALQLDLEDLRHRLLGGPEIDQPVAVDAPGAAGDDAPALPGPGCAHAARRPITASAAASSPRS